MASVSMPSLASLDSSDRDSGQYDLEANRVEEELEEAVEDDAWRFGNPASPALRAQMIPNGAARPLLYLDDGIIEPAQEEEDEDEVFPVLRPGRRSP